MEENITGGVSPLKKGKWRGRRGKRGGTVGDTRYKRDKWVKPKSGGTTVKAPKAPNPKKPYTIAPDGKVQMTPPGDVNITEGKTTTTKEYVPDEGAVLTINDEGHSVTRMLGAVGKYKLGGYRAMKKNRK